MSDDTANRHRRIAAWLNGLYRASEHAPEGWRETAAWHWEQAGDHTAAAQAALDVTETSIARLDFHAARQWVRRALELIERLTPEERATIELRAYALVLAVLEFGGQYREALDYAKRMLRAARTLNHREAEVRALIALGRMQRELGQFPAAEMALLEARATGSSDELGELEADIRLHLAKVYQLQGRHLEALQELRLAEDESAIQDDQVKLARVLTGIGDIYRVLGATRETLIFYNRALSIEQGRGSLLGQGLLREKLALTLLAQGKLDEARASAEESLRLRQFIGDIVGQARALSVIGTITGRMGQHGQAIAYHERAQDLDEQTQNVRGQGVAHLHIGDEARALRNFTMARQQYARALTLAQNANDQLALARTLERMGDLNLEDGKRDVANSCWAEALQIRELLRHADEAAALRERIRSGVLPKG
jgi:tetratricopeptide (TPR) repeat protein